MDANVKNTVTVHVDDEAPHCTIYWNNISFEVTKVLTLAQMLSFVNGVVSSCFDKDTGEYRPEIRDFITRCAIIDMYTNIALPDDVKDKYRLLYETDIIQSILPSISHGQYDAMMNAIDKKVDNMAESNIQSLTRQLGEIADKFSDLEEEFSGVFDGVDSKTIENMANAFATSSVSEESLLKYAASLERNEQKVVPITRADE